MLDLNAPSLYKEKINSYAKNVLNFSTKSNILSLFKIKKYTGKGITKNGNVKIDEKGIATIFKNLSDYVITNVDIMDVKFPYEFQIKFKVSNKAEFNQLYLMSNKTYAYPYFEFLTTNGRIVFESFTNQYGDKHVFFSDSFDFDADKWYIINIKHEQKGIYACTIYDEKYTELYNKTQNSEYEITYQSDKIILGGDIDYPHVGGPTLQIDLSETYFKSNDTIISEWNL